MAKRFSHCHVCAKFDDDEPTPRWSDNAPGDGCHADGSSEACEGVWVEDESAPSEVKG